MEHVYNLEQANLETPSLVTIGVFDGVHKGHQALIKKLVDTAHSQGRLAVVLTFFPHPVTEFYILDGRELEPFRVESAQLRENGAPYGTAPRPERIRLRVRPLMNEVMEQVPVLRYEIRSPGSVVVRPENRRYIRVAIEDIRETITLPMIRLPWR